MSRAYRTHTHKHTHPAHTLAHTCLVTRCDPASALLPQDKCVVNATCLITHHDHHLTRRCPQPRDPLSLSLQSTLRYASAQHKQHRGSSALDTIASCHLSARQATRNTARGGTGGCAGSRGRRGRYVKSEGNAVSIQ